MQHLKIIRQFWHTILTCHLYLGNISLKIAQRPLDHNFSMVHDAHMVTGILKFPQVMGGH